jgi:hypothetical protein
MSTTVQPKQIPLTIGRIEVSLGGLRVVEIRPEQQNHFIDQFDWDNPTVKAVIELAARLDLHSYRLIGNPWDVAGDKKRILFGHPNNPQDDAHGMAIDVAKNGAMEVIASETARAIVCSNTAAIGLLYGQTSAPEFYELAGRGIALRVATPEAQKHFIAHARLHALRQAHDCRSH